MWRFGKVTEQHFKKLQRWQRIWKKLNQFENIRIKTRITTLEQKYKPSSTTDECLPSFSDYASATFPVFQRFLCKQLQAH